MAQLTDEQIAELRRLLAEGVPPSEVARRVGCRPSQVTYHGRGIDRPPTRRGRPPRKLSERALDDLPPEALDAPLERPPKRAHAPAPTGRTESRGGPGTASDEAARSHSLDELAPEAVLDELASENATTENIRRLKELRDDPRATVSDQIRAADLLMKWQRGLEEAELNQPLTDEQYEDLLVTMFEEMDGGIRARVWARVQPLLSEPTRV